MRTTVLHAERQALVRRAVSTVLAVADDISLVGEAPTFKATKECVAALHPAIVLLDSRILDGVSPGGHGWLRDELAAEILVTGGDASVDGVLDVLAAGVAGYLPPQASASHMLSAIRAVARGELALPRALHRGLLRRMLERGHDQQRAMLCLFRLTPQEQRVLRLLAEGTSNTRMAEELVISPQTARTHIQNILSKLGVHSRLEAVAYVTHNHPLGDLLKAMA